MWSCETELSCEQHQEQQELTPEWRPIQLAAETRGRASQLEVRRKRHIIQTQVKIPQSKWENGAKTARRKDPTMGLTTDNRERTVRREHLVCRAQVQGRLHQTCWPVNQNEHVCVEKCPLTTRHAASAAVAAASEEQECRALLEKLRWESTPEAEAEHTRSTLVSTLRLITRAGQRRAQRLVSPANHAQHVGEHAVHKRTVRQQRAHGEPWECRARRDRQTDENVKRPQQHRRTLARSQQTQRRMIQETRSEKSGPTAGNKSNHVGKERTHSRWKSEATAGKKEQYQQ